MMRLRLKILFFFFLRMAAIKPDVMPELIGVLLDYCFNEYLLFSR